MFAGNFNRMNKNWLVTNGNRYESPYSRPHTQGMRLFSRRAGC